MATMPDGKCKQCLYYTVSQEIHDFEFGGVPVRMAGPLRGKCEKHSNLITFNDLVCADYEPRYEPILPEELFEI